MNIKKQTLINGRPEQDYTSQEIINMIARTEDEIRTLEKLQTKSEHIDKKIGEHKDSCVTLAKFLDKRPNDE
jgi:DNA-directed RNA polymerase sigma subunit (sigma70/sigma32)